MEDPFGFALKASYRSRGLIAKRTQFAAMRHPLVRQD